MEYCSYLEIISQIDRIKKGDIIYVISDVLDLMKVTSLNGEKFDANKFIDTIIAKTGTDGTVLFPVFNWDFNKGKPFDYYKTPSRTGALGNVALKRPDFKRTKHPIYSFAVWGKDKEALFQKEYINSWGKGSIFDYLIQNRAIALVINLPTMQGNTMLHHVEQMVGVPYRFDKNFTAMYTDWNGHTETKTYSQYVRDLDINARERTAPLNHILEALNISNTQIINGIAFRTVFLKEMYDVEEIDIKLNDCRNCYDYVGQLPQKKLTEKYEW